MASSWDPFAAPLPHGAPLLWRLEDVLKGCGIPAPALAPAQDAAAAPSSSSAPLTAAAPPAIPSPPRRHGTSVATTPAGTPKAAAAAALQPPLPPQPPDAVSQEHAMAAAMASQRRVLPRVLDDRSLFTRAVPPADTDGGADPSGRRVPSQRIGAHYSPGAAALPLFEASVQSQQGSHAAIGKRPSAAGITGSSSSTGTRRSPSPTSHGNSGSLISSSGGGGSGSVAYPLVGSPLTPWLPPGSTAVGNQHVPTTSTVSSHATATAGAAAAVTDKTALESFFELEVADAILLYHHYLESSIADADVAPFPEDWAQWALEKLPPGAAPRLSQERRDVLLAACLEELRPCHLRAAKRGILNYVIKSPAQRRRLLLSPLSPLLDPAPPPAGRSLSGAVGTRYRVPPFPTSAAGAAARRLPPEWGKHVAAARDEVVWGLQTLNPNALELQRLWYDSGYSAARLLDASSPELVARLPAEADVFRSHQVAATEQLKAQLWTHWLPKCADVFVHTPPVAINDDAAAYFRSVAVLQGNQLRQLVTASLSEFLALFRRHASPAPLDPLGGPAAAAAGPPSVFETELVVDVGTAAFRPALAAAEAAALGSLDAAVSAVCGLPRLGRGGAAALAAPCAAASGGVGGSGAAGSTIPVAGPGDDGVVAAREELRAILEANAAGPWQLAGLFDTFLPLLSLDSQQHAASVLADCGGPVVVPASAAAAAAAGAASAPGPSTAAAAGTPAPPAAATTSSSGAVPTAVAAAATGDAGATPQQPGGGPDLVPFEAEVSRLLGAAEAIRSACDDGVHTGLYLVRTARFKAQLASAAEAAATALLELLRSQTRDASDAVSREYSGMVAEVVRPTAGAEEAMARKRYIGRCGLESEKLKAVIAANRAREDLLFKFRHPIPDDDFDAARRAAEWPRRAADALREGMAAATAEHRKSEGALKARRKAFADVVERCATDVAAVEAKGDVIKRDPIASEVNALEARIASAAREAEAINTHERLFGWTLTKYDRVPQLEARVAPVVRLWGAINSFYNAQSSWMGEAFWRLDAAVMEEACTSTHEQLTELAQLFGGKALGGGAGAAGGNSTPPDPPRPSLLAAAEEGLARVAAFRAHVPLVAALTSPALHERHWEAMAAASGGAAVRGDEGATLKRLLDSGVEEQMPRLRAIQEAAEREAAVDAALAAIAAEWEARRWELEPRGPGLVLPDARMEEAGRLLKEHTSKLAEMAGTPDGALRADDIATWAAKLGRLQHALSDWITCQAAWTALQQSTGAGAASEGKQPADAKIVGGVGTEAEGEEGGVEAALVAAAPESGALRAANAAWRVLTDRAVSAVRMVDAADWSGLEKELAACRALVEVAEADAAAASAAHV